MVAKEGFPKKEKIPDRPTGVRGTPGVVGFSKGGDNRGGSGLFSYYRLVSVTDTVTLNVTGVVTASVTFNVTVSVTLGSRWCRTIFSCGPRGLRPVLVALHLRPYPTCCRAQGKWETST